MISAFTWDREPQGAKDNRRVAECAMIMDENGARRDSSLAISGAPAVLLKETR